MVMGRVTGVDRIVLWTITQWPNMMLWIKGASIHSMPSCVLSLATCYPIGSAQSDIPQMCSLAALHKQLPCSFRREVLKEFGM